MKAVPLIPIIALLFLFSKAGAQIPANLLQAIQANQPDKINELHLDSTQINSRDANMATPLFWATYLGDLPMVKYLVAQGADPLVDGAICLDDSCGSYYGSLLCIAAGEGKLDIIQYFVEELQLEINALEWNVETKKRGIPPEPDTLKGNGGKPYNWGNTNSAEWAPITWAVENNHTTIVRYLLAKGADPEIIPGEALRIAIENRNKDIIFSILESKKIELSVLDLKNIASEDNDTLLLQLVERRFVSIPWIKTNEQFRQVKLTLDSAYWTTAIYFQVFNHDSIAFKYSELELEELLKTQPLDTSRIVARLRNLGNRYFKSENHKKGDFYLNEWLKWLEQVDGYRSEAYAIGLREYTDTLMEHRLYTSAENRFRELRALWEQLEGKESRSQAVCLNNIGWSLNKQTRFGDAETYLKESVALWRRLPKQEPAELKITLWNLGETLIGLERFEEAAEIWQERLLLTQSVFGENSRDAAVALNDLGWLNYLKKDYLKAEMYLLKSLDTKSDTWRIDPVSYKITCDNLTNVYKELKETQKELEVKRMLLDTLLHFKGFESTVIDLYGGIGKSYRTLKYYDYAITSFKYQLEMEVRLNGTEKWNYWDIHSEIAETYYEKGEYSTAKEWYEKYEKSGFRAAKESMVIVNKALGNYDEAERNYTVLLDDLKKSNSEILKQTSRGFKFLIADWNQKSYHLGYSTAFLSHSNTAGINAFNIALHAKNAILEETKQINHFVTLSGNIAFQDSLKRLSEMQNTYANLFHFQSKENAAALGNDLKSRIGSIQAYLSKVYYESLPEKKQSFDTEWKDIQTSLKGDEAAIEFVNFKLHRIQWTDSTIYAAVVIRPGWDAPRFITLFEADSLLSLLSDMQIRGQGYAEYLYPGSGRVVPVGKPKISLHQLIWDKLDTLLQGAHTIYFSSSGYLNRLNLGAIVNPNKQIAIERYRLVQMTSTRQLVQQRLPIKPNKTAVLFGGLQYSTDSISIALSAAKLQRTKTGSTRSDPSGWGMSAEPMDTLPFTRVEVIGIVPTLKKSGYKVQLFTDFQGIEEALYSVCTAISSPRILHISTHGFFFDKPNKGDDNEEKSRPSFELSNVNMLRSGIVFSGCNHFWTTGKTYPGMHDGILTAYEAAQLNLANTELVVLSACESGLGELNAEDGVFGLQRSFLQAGAHYVIISLWKVDDIVTKEFMVTFYQKWLAEKKEIPDAFRETEIEIRKSHGSAYFWAPFILIQ